MLKKIDTGLADPKVAATLKKLHARARGDVWKFARALPAVALARARGRNIFDAMAPHFKDAYIPVDPDQGKLLYVTARAIEAKTIVEFGTSFAISTIYLAAAARANGGRVIGTEMEPTKVKAARANVAEAGLAQFVDIREGDAMKTLAALEHQIDFLLLDGWKDIYLPMIKMLSPKMRAGAVVLADNIFTFKKTLRPYVAHMQDRTNGFESVTLPIGHGMEYSVRLS
ncbi:MAG: class I SAM-dependent methyltransferase [Alphaproteobacteria bacterium]|jgi:predicted O-methyltransferase YrrM|nr:class I SAM-dependent methyltransferase [Alphaproteobacteria bacterium]